MTPRSSTVLLAGSILVGALALAPSAQAQSRGELLYSTHCIACHTTQMHWRDKKQATDWYSLKAQVRAWQATARLEWSEDDVAEVARYLNERFYRFVQPSAALDSLKPARADQRAISTDAYRVEHAAGGDRGTRTSAGGRPVIADPKPTCEPGFRAVCV